MTGLTDEQVFSPNEFIRVVTKDGMRYAGPVLKTTQQFVRIFDEKTQTEIVILLTQIQRAEVHS